MFKNHTGVYLDYDAAIRLTLLRDKVGKDAKAGVTRPDPLVAALLGSMSMVEIAMLNSILSLDAHANHQAPK